jgi:hypothetical protein
MNVGYVSMPSIVRVLRAVHAGYSAARGVHPPPTPTFGAGRRGQAGRVALVAGLAALALIALGLPASLPSGWVSDYRLASAAVLLPVGAWLSLRARRARAARGLWSRMIEWLLEIGGLVMLAVGVLELILALV